jgi:hypothetical protein
VSALASAQPTTADGAAPTGGSTLADLARRVATARGGAAAPAPVAPPPSPSTPTATAELVYYRFVGPEGTVYITRERPETYPYDVLSP